MNSLGERLKARRLELGYSLEKVATLASTSKSYIWELENDPSVNPTIQTIMKIAPSLNVTPPYLAFGDDMTMFERGYSSAITDARVHLDKMDRLCNKE